MEEYFSKALDLNGSEIIAAEIKKNGKVKISVTGYDISSPAEDIKTALIKHFGSCGEIVRVYVPPGDVGTNTLNSFAFIYFLEEDAEEKALGLSGSDVGGWTVVAKSLTEKNISPEVAAKRARYFKTCRSARIPVAGYDTSSPEDDITRALIKHFSSCGEITDVYIPREGFRTDVLSSCSFIYILGEGAEEKALQLNGSDAGGWNVIVGPGALPPEEILPWRGWHGYTVPACYTNKKAKNTTE